jgi:hypothetical protein
MAAKKQSKDAKRYLQMLIGAILIVAGIYGIAMWWWDELYVLIKGGLGLVIALVGLIIIMMSTEG